MRAPGGAVVLISLVGLVACSGQQQQQHSVAAPAARASLAELEDLQVDLEAVRVGSALRLDVRAAGRFDRAGAPFENPELWRIDARQRDRGLQRLVNGSVRVERTSHGLRVWDTEVRFSVVYAIHTADAVHVRLVPPESRAVDRVIEL